MEQEGKHMRLDDVSVTEKFEKQKTWWQGVRHHSFYRWLYLISGSNAASGVPLNGINSRLLEASASADEEADMHDILDKTIIKNIAEEVIGTQHY